MGSTLCHWPLASVVGGFCPPSLCVIDGRCALLLSGGWLIRVAVGWYLSSMGGTRGRKGKSEPRISSWFAMSAPSFYGDGGVRCREMRGEIGENEHDFHRVRFRDALAGPPPVFVPPQIRCRARMSCLHPSGKGRVGVHLRWLGPLVIATWFITLALGRGGVTAAGLDMSSLCRIPCHWAWFMSLPPTHCR